MKEITYSCPSCLTSFTTAADRAGEIARCWSCGKDIQIPAPEAAPSPPLPSTAQEAHSELPKPVNGPSNKPVEASGILKAGWICFGLGIFFLPIFFLIPICGALFMASFILSIIAIAQKRPRAGLALLLSTLFIPVITGSIIFFLILGAATKSLDEFSASFKQSIPSPPQTASPAQKNLLTASSSQKSTRRISSVPTKTLGLEELLSYMDQNSRGLQNADTSVARSDIINSIQKATRNALADHALQFTATITDVQMVGAGKYRVSFSELSDGGLSKKTSSLLRIIPAQSITLQMEATRARDIHPGQTIIIRAKADLSNGPLLPPNYILNMFTKSPYQKIGAIYLLDSTYSIKN